MPPVCTRDLARTSDAHALLEMLNVATLLLLAATALASPAFTVDLSQVRGGARERLTCRREKYIAPI